MDKRFETRNQASPWNKVILQRLTLAQLVDKFYVIYETKRLFTEFKRPYPGPDESNPHIPNIFSLDPF
jgi:hypothetical protein